MGYDDRQLDRLVDAASRAPSAGKTQGWHLVVLEGSDTARFWDVTLPPDGQSATIRVSFTAKDAGPRMFRFLVKPQDATGTIESGKRTGVPGAGK